MSTIAYRDGVLAADSMSTRGGVVVAHCGDKIAKISNSSGEMIIHGGVGEISVIHKFRHWLSNKPVFHRDWEPPFDVGDNTQIVLTSLGLFMFENDFFFSGSGCFAAWGSGHGAASGAMHAGASAQEAVEIAGRVDTHSGGEVISMTLDEGFRVSSIIAGAELDAARKASPGPLISPGGDGIPLNRGQNG